MKNVVVTFEGNKDGSKVLKYWNAIECLDSSIIIDLKQFQKKLKFIYVEKSPFVSFNVSGRRRRWLKFGVQLRSADFRKVYNFEQGAMFINTNKTKLQLRPKWNIDKTSLK